MNREAFLGLALFVTCVIVREPLEQSAAMHTLVLLPLLAASGWLMMPKGSTFGHEWNKGGFCTLLIAIFTIAFWMLPRAIDASLENTTVELAKFISVPLGVGAALALGWPRAHPIMRGFLKAQALSMLGFMAFLYTHSPVRVCNAYLESDQIILGYGFLFAAIGLAIYWTVPLFLPQHGTVNEAQFQTANL